jgi:hypothetical protein
MPPQKSLEDYGCHALKSSHYGSGGHRSGIGGSRGGFGVQGCSGMAACPVGCDAQSAGRYPLGALCMLLAVLSIVVT